MTSKRLGWRVARARCICEAGGEGREREVEEEAGREGREERLKKVGGTECEGERRRACLCERRRESLGYLRG